MEHIKIPLDKFIDGLSRETFKMTKAEAQKNGVCISCKKNIKPWLDKSTAAAMEYDISALCPDCFFNITVHDAHHMCDW